MSERTLKQLVGALSIAAAIWAVTALLSGGTGSIGASGEITSLFEGLGESSLQAVRIDGPDGLVELVRAGDDWTANGYPGDPSSTSRLLEVLAELKVGDLIATNPANHDRMGVSLDSAVGVEFEVDGALSSILVGKQGRRFATSYVRLPDSDEVYLLEGDLRVQVTRRLDSWRNRTMVTIDSASVSRITVEREGDAYTLVRGDSTWTFEGGDPARPTFVTGILAELSSLVATGFLVEGDSIEALEPGGRTLAYSSTGEVLADITIGTGSGDRWARTTSDEYVYRVSSFRAGRLVPLEEDVAPDAEPG